MCPRTGRSLKARAWRHGSGFSSRLHVGYISDTIFIGLAKGLVWRTEEGVFCVRQMQGGKREEACLERRRLDNAVESDVEEMDDTSRYTRYRYNPPLKPMSYGQGRIVLQQQHAAKNIPALIPYTIVACGTMKKPTVRKTKIVNEVIKLHANQMLHSLCEWASKV